MIDLKKIIPDYRNSVDLLFFSNRLDTDLLKYKKYILADEKQLDYLLLSFTKSTHIFWENGNELWNHRLHTLFSLNIKKINKLISQTIEENMFTLIKVKQNIDPINDVEYLQFIQYCKVKHKRKDSLSHIQEYLINLSNQIKASKIVDIIHNFIPYIFKDIESFTNLIINKISESSIHLKVLKELEKQGISYNKDNLINLCNKLILEKPFFSKNRNAIFKLLEEDFILQNIKQNYSAIYKKKIIDLFNECEYGEIEFNHLTNIKNIIKLDETLINDIQIIYADKLYSKQKRHFKYAADRLVKFLKKIPQANARKILSYLSSKNKMSDVKYIIKSFPELNKLSAFV